MVIGSERGCCRLLVFRPTMPKDWPRRNLKAGNLKRLAQKFAEGARPVSNNGLARNCQCIGVNAEQEIVAPAGDVNVPLRAIGLNTFGMITRIYSLERPQRGEIKHGNGAAILIRHEAASPRQSDGIWPAARRNFTDCFS